MPETAAHSGGRVLTQERCRMPKKKVYAVRRGRTPGLYETWSECQRQTTGFRGAEFKSFTSRAEAQAWVDAANAPAGEPPTSGIAVDGACSGNPGPMEYQGVDIATGETLFSDGPYAGGTNNLAEFLAIVDAARLIEDGKHAGPIWSDSNTAMIWVSKGVANSTVDPRKVDPALRLLVTEAENWLASRGAAAAPLPVFKWETDVWGEVPADFGRKG
jgi:ribonuclease HI